MKLETTVVTKSRHAVEAGLHRASPAKPQERRRSPSNWSLMWATGGIIRNGEECRVSSDGASAGIVPGTQVVVKNSTGEIVGTVHRPSGMLIAHSEHQCVLAATKRVADALSKTL